MLPLGMMLPLGHGYDPDARFDALPELGTMLLLSNDAGARRSGTIQWQ
jgi:hypothetical protein